MSQAQDWGSNCAVRSMKRNLPRRYVPVERRIKGEPSRANHGEGQGSGEDPGSAAAKNSPAYGVWNVQIVTAGTGEALADRSRLRNSVEVRRPITGDEPGNG